jgi:hypothetical protein
MRWFSFGDRAKLHATGEKAIQLPDFFREQNWKR